MKKIILWKLKIVSRIILKKYKPEVIGITGSVGKTSAKEAVFAVLSFKNKVRRSEKNYNNEIGVPLTIIGADSPGRSLIGWFFVFMKACGLILWKSKKYPEILILEMGVDHPGDMDYLLSIAECNMGLVTFVGSSHLEHFGSVKKIQKEKGKLIESIPKEGWSILNYDNLEARKIADLSKAKVLTYGFDSKADIRAQELVFSVAKRAEEGVGGKKMMEIGNLSGISFKLGYKGSFVPALLPNVIGYSAVYAALAGAAMGIAHGMNLVEISQALSAVNFPKGRMNLIAGLKNTLIVDDTYNASPQSCKIAFEVIKDMPLFKKMHKYAILGDMLELGSYTEEGHKEVGRYVVDAKIDKLIVVGEKARDIARGAEEAGMDEDDIFHFADNESANVFIKERIKTGDLIFVKGSQGARMEQVVKELMAEPSDAAELLVRQEKKWLNK